MLVDTSVLYWYLKGSPDLGKAAFNLIDSPRPVHFSPISVFELQSKALRNYFQLPQNLGAAVISAGFTELPVKAEDFLELANFPSLSRHDPMDRILLCQAARHRMTFLTADELLLGLDFDWIIDGRS
jgi:PIN domain nuclease of toxin-antitoxin system